MEETGAFVATGVLPNFGPNSRTILPIQHTFPTRCGTDNFFHFSICFSNCLEWTTTNILDQEDCMFLGCSHLNNTIFTISFTD